MKFEKYFSSKIYTISLVKYIGQYFVHPPSRKKLYNTTGTPLSNKPG